MDRAFLIKQNKSSGIYGAHPVLFIIIIIQIFKLGLVKYFFFFIFFFSLFLLILFIKKQTNLKYHFFLIFLKFFVQLKI